MDSAGESGEPGEHQVIVPEPGTGVAICPARRLPQTAIRYSGNVRPRIANGRGSPAK